MNKGLLIEGLVGGVGTVGQILDLTPGTQCCLRCGRVLTDRLLHDSVEEPVLASIRASHPEWARESGACPPCLGEYRRLLSGRRARADRPREEGERVRGPGWLKRVFGGRGSDRGVVPV